MHDGKLLRVVDLQSRIGAREKAHGAARAAARFVGDHVPELSAGVAFLGGAALLAGALAPREKAHAVPSAVGTLNSPKGPALHESEPVHPLSAEEPHSSTLTAPDHDGDSDTELVKRESEEAQRSQLERAEMTSHDKGSAEVAVSAMKLQEVRNAPDAAPSVPHTGAPPQAEAKPDTVSTKSRRLRKRRTLKVVVRKAHKDDAPLAKGDLLHAPETAPEPAPAAVTHAGATGQDLREMRAMSTRNLIYESNSARFCARCRVHDLCDIFLLNYPGTSVLDMTGARLVLNALLLNQYGALTTAQKAYLDRFQKNGTMNAQIPENADVSELVKALGTDLVHADYGHVEVWDVRKCTSLREAFKGSSIKGSLDLSFWDTRNVTDASEAFSGTSLDVDVSTWDMREVNDTSSMFYEAKGFNGDVSEWDVSNVRDMTRMFALAPKFNGDVSRWDVGLVEKMGRMFYAATSFTGGGVEKWRPREGVDVTDMFGSAPNVGKEAQEWAAQRAKSSYGRARRRGFV